MKKLMFITLIILISFQMIFSQIFEFTPININFSSIESKGDTIAVLGDFGSMLISFDNAETWEQKRVFDKGKMVKLFFLDNQMLAFNDVGQISNSIDNGNSWNLMTDLDDSVFAVIKYPQGFFLRSDSNLFIISNDFKIENDFTLFSPFLGDYYYKTQYRKSLAYFSTLLIAAIDSARFLRFDENLSLIDTIYFSNLTIDTSIYGRYQIDIDSIFFYSNIDNHIYRTKDFKTSEIIYDRIDNYRFISNSFYYIRFPGTYNLQHENFTLSLHKIINQDSSNTVFEFSNHYVTSNIRPNDFTIVNDKLIFVGDDKFFVTINLSDSVVNLISDFSGGNYNTTPDIINDSTFLFFMGYYSGTYYNRIYKTNNLCMTFKPTVDIKLNPDYINYYYVEFKYFDEKDKVIYLISGYDFFTKSMVMISKDEGLSFTYKELPENNFYYGIVPYPLFKNIPNIYKRGDNFILASNKMIEGANTKILTYNKDFDLISEFKDSNYVINYVYSSDTNTFVIHCINFIDTTREFRYTSDKGLNWEVIRKYPNADSMLYYKEITIDDKPALAMFLYNELDSFVTIEILDFDTRIFSNIYKYKITKLSYEKLINNGIFRDSNYIYIAIQDTLFFTNNIYDYSKWKYINFPYNGKIIRTCNKYGDTFFARYSDDIHPNNIYWIKITDFDKPKPLISANDYDFGKRDIKDSVPVNAKLIIENPSQDADLLITGYSYLSETALSTDLPSVDSLNPLIIKPNEYFEYNVNFKPTEIKEYKDSIIFYSNALGSDNITYLAGEGIDTTTTVIDIEIEIQNYLYAYPSFPMPAKNYVKTLIYWDLSLDINKDEIAIFNIYGEKIEGRERIRIDKQNSYSGWLVWDCSDVKSGIYFIKINHGTRTLYLKVMVDR